MSRLLDAVRMVFLPGRRDVARPDGVGERALPRFDLLIAVVATVAGALLVLADILQRTLASHELNQLDIDGHANPETWFHSAVLVGAALCAFGIAFTYFETARRLWWLVLGAGIAFFSMDKTTSLHEHVGARLVVWLNLPEDSERVAWEVAWSPIILVVVVALFVCVWRTDRRTQLWSAGLLVAGAGKIALEALTFGAVHWLGASETRGWFYGIEANVEESLQLVAFASLFAGFAQYGIERLGALARDELDAFDASRETLTLPVWLESRLPAFGRRRLVGAEAVPATERG
jgi:hypothetical protein